MHQLTHAAGRFVAGAVVALAMTVGLTSLTAAFVLFAPLAVAILMQAAQIVS